ncbi:VC0807 family protein [Actinomycetospora sp. CA-101289]|uniref:VC0807 family protein n=1 Tax=Actinomycetospora sp. CA-101289 TaxID=3239893 RepID=UPI003D9721DD
MESPASTGSALVGLGVDIGLPLVGYYTVHGVGGSDWLALLVATAAAGVRLVAVAVWTRRISWFAAIMFGVFGVGLALAFVGGEPRFLLLKDSFTTAVIGAVFLVSLVGEHPLTLAGAQSWTPHRAEELAALYRTRPAARRAFRVSALGWGLGLVAEAALRVPLIYLLPLEVAVGASTAMMIVAMAGLAVWNGAYITRAARREPALSVLLPGGGSARTRQ